MSTKEVKPSLRPIHWVLDWDGTITRKDTLNALVNIAAASRPTFPTHDRWKQVVDAYLTDYTTKLKQLTPNDTLPTTLSAEKELLKALKPVEQASINRVYAQEIFAGLTSKTIHDGARRAIDDEEVEFRPGLATLFQEFNNDISILSVNWSRAFIISCLESITSIEPSAVFANELDGINDNRPSSGEICPPYDPIKVISSDDKLRYLNTHIRPAHPDSRIVYIGDSWPDIECLVDADVGICMRDEPMGSSQQKLADALNRLSIECRHVNHWQESGTKQLLWARDFEEVMNWAKKIRYMDS